MKRIAIATPSRGRCQKAIGYIQSIQDTAIRPERIEVALRVDDDDDQVNDYLNIGAMAWLVKVHIEVGPTLLGDIGEMWNVLLSHIDADIYMMGNDDLVHKTLGWDVILEKYVAQYPDEIYCLWFNDTINGNRHCAFPIVSRKWIETVGFWFPKGLKYCYPDTWVYDLGKRVGRAVYIPEVTVEHQWMGAKKDETYRRSRAQGEGDAQAFIDREHERVAQAEKLWKVMQP